MLTSSRLGWPFAVALCVFFLQASANVARAQDEAGEEAGPAIITRVYPVADLVFSPPNYPFQGVDMAGSRARGATGFGGMSGSSGGGGMGGFGSGFMGGMGGGMGGGGGMANPVGSGQFNVQDNRAHTRATAGSSMDLDELIEAITTSIAANSWDEVGGPGSIITFNNQLVVSQTEAVQEQIAKLLAELRKQSALETITVRATWLSLDGEQLAALTAGTPATSPPLVDRAKLEALSKEAGAAPRAATAPAVDAGEVTCFNGQTVHIVSGRFRGAVTSVIPVVGQLEETQKTESAVAAAENASPATSARRMDETVLAQVVAESTGPAVSPQLNNLQGGLANQGVGYQPIVSTQHSGIMLEVTPIAMPGANAIVLDLRSIVSQWQPPAAGTASFGGITQLDHSEVISQQLATTIRMPLGKPVIAGGMTLEPGAATSTGARLYLVVEAVTSTEK